MFYPAGVYSAMLTAFSADGSLNEEVNRQLVEMQIEGGLDGIFPVSSSGESVAMDFASRSSKIRPAAGWLSCRASPAALPRKPWLSASMPVNAAVMGSS